MTPSQALVAATKNGAIAPQAPDHSGTLETGKLADILLLDADPTVDIGDIRSLSFLMKEGRIIDLDARPENTAWTERPKM